MKGMVDKNINIEEMVVDFSDVKKTIDELVKDNLKNKNRELLLSFVEYCNKNPEQRFFQALRNWSGEEFIMAADYNAATDKFNYRDTFYWKELDQ